MPPPVAVDLGALQDKVSTAGERTTEAAQDANLSGLAATDGATAAVQAAAKAAVAAAATTQAGGGGGGGAGTDSSAGGVVTGMADKYAQDAARDAAEAVAEAVARASTAKDAYENSARAAEAAAAAATALSAKLPTPKSRHLLITSTQGHKTQATAAGAAADAADDLLIAVRKMQASGGALDACTVVTAKAAALARIHQRHEKAADDATGFWREAVAGFAAAPSP
jgi:hypothetical protein